ncbi:Holliday junction resolvase RuvX [Candidatus Dojkabacteria bacterium]|uniref:Putative pre-16S rRNA nuclease n=1 Tax=Candidatus Dojkabacteria bacterium TaxID=2099670 RepID=A0A847VCE0_9BACT|nr:Holliday junction resolvase RuvX [Candidatus Dojkabacteria bacterium]
MKIEKPILAIDYGLKRIGLAISDSKGITSAPLKVITVTKRRKMEGAIDDILLEIETNRVKTIVIGKTNREEWGNSKTSQRTEYFVSELKKRTQLPIIFQDESYSTTRAQNMLLSLGQSSKSSKEKIDMYSAVVILEDFLNSDNKKNEDSN